MASCGLIERPSFGDTERYNTGMNQPCKETLAEKSLKSIVCAPVAASGAPKELEFEDKAVVPVAHDEIEAMQAVEADCCPFLALVPTIRTTMKYCALDETSTFSAIWLAGLWLIPWMRVNVRSGILHQNVADQRKNNAPLKVTFACKVTLEIRSA